jgi:hypothetical protein
MKSQDAATLSSPVFTALTISISAIQPRFQLPVTLLDKLTVILSKSSTMKAVFSLFALSGLFASSLAAPVVQVEGLTATAGGLVEALPTVTLPVLSEVSVPEVAVKRDISVTEVMTKVQGLLVTVKEHTAIISKL